MFIPFVFATEEVLVPDSYYDQYFQWEEYGSSPYADDLEGQSPTNYFTNDASGSGPTFLTFEDSTENVDTVPTNVNLTVSYKVSVGYAMKIKFYNITADGYDLLDTVTNTGGVYTNASYNVTGYFATIDNINDAKVVFDRDASGGVGMYVDYAELIVTYPGSSPATPNNIPYLDELAELIVPLLVILLCAFVGWRFAKDVGFLAGLNLGVLLCVFYLNFPEWTLVLMVIVDVLSFFGRK